MDTSKLRRLYRAARAVDTLPARAAALAARYDAAAAALRVELATAAGPLTIADYRIAPGPDGSPIVTRQDIPADQLALWRELLEPTT